MFKNQNVHYLKIFLSIFVIIFISSVTCNFILFAQNKKLFNSSERVITEEWYRLYRTMERIKSDITYGNIGNKNVSLVNHVCYNLQPTAGYIDTSELSWDLRNWLVFSYDIIYRELYNSDEIHDPDRAMELLIDMTNELLDISENVVFKYNKKALLDNNSNEYKMLLDRIKTGSIKYIEETDRYFSMKNKRD